MIEKAGFDAIVKAAEAIAGKAQEAKLQTEMTQVMTQLESFRVGEMSAKELSNAEIIKRRESEAAAELRDILNMELETTEQQKYQVPLDENPMVNERINAVKNIKEEPGQQEEISGKRHSEVGDTDHAAIDNTSEIKQTADSLDDLHDEYDKEVRESSAAGDVQDSDRSNWEKTSTEEHQESRREFEQEKERLIAEWEEKNGMEWPTYEEDVYNENGKLIRRKGDRYDAHHIQPLEFGGKNNSDNITPIHAKDHYDKQGVHRPDSPYDKLCKHYRNN
jgi:hypothetical protein